MGRGYGTEKCEAMWEQGRCTFAITLEDCFRGLFVAKRDRFFDFRLASSRFT